MKKKKSTKKIAKQSKKPAKKTAKKAVKKVKKAVSKTTKNVEQKKAKTKKPTRGNKGKKVLAVAVGDDCFWVNYGPSVRDLLELRDVLYDINEEQFKHHVNNMKNDFAEWIEGVLEDKKTATQIRKAKTLNSMIKVVEKSLKDYKI